MALAAGTRLGPYEIVSPLGAGGMGEVYRARDTRLERTVAIKVLNAELVANPALRGRFEREAKVISQLNHPNICTLYDVGSESGTDYLVMEYLEGETLADRIRKGPLPLDQFVKVGCEIADALDKAHRAGIVHRDLKPGNVMLTKSGTKLLDFGLAKPAAMSAVAGGGSAPLLSAAITMTSPNPQDSPLTSAGMLVGTIQYMSPEQLQGIEADARSDIFALGSVLYEMRTGKRAFEGKSQLTVASSILEKDPEPVTVRGNATPALAHVIDRCLNKDPEQRWQSAGDISRELLWAGKAAAEEAPSATSGRTSRLAPILGGVAALLLIATIGLVIALWSRPTNLQKSAVRLTIPLPPGQEIISYPAITRDGRTVAYVTQQGADDSQLYLRDLNSFSARVVAGASGAKQPFFSPDGKWIAFFAQGQLQKAEVAGGAPIRLAEAGYSFGGTWNDDNTIIYTTSLGSGLLRIPASGGTPVVLTKPDGAAQGYAHVFPQALPGGRSVLFTVWGQTQGGAVLSLDSGHWDVVLPSAGWFGAGTFQATGGSRGRILLVDQAAGIRAAPFDVAHPGRTSADTSVLADVNYEVETESLGWLAVSDTGTAVYATGNPAKTSLAWVDREGKMEALGGGQDVYREASLSPDGVKAVFRYGLDLWIHDLQRGTRSRLTSGSGSNILPLWSRDGTRIIYASNRGGDWDIYSQSADGSRPAETLLKRPRDQFPLSFLPDGTLMYVEIQPNTGRDLWMLSPDGKTSPFRVTPFNETQAEVSPGPGPRWVAYGSDESGRNEIYMQSYPSGDHRVAVSTGGGILPRWSPDGKELFYVSGDAVVSVAMRPDGSFGAPRRLFDRSNFLFNHRFHSYSVSPDGKRFLMIRRDPGSVPRQLNVILNWSGEAEQPAANK